MNSALVQELFSREVVVFVTDPLTQDPDPIAQAWVERRPEFLSPSRRLELLAGRSLAVKAMRALGLDAVPLDVGPGRAPLWPEGMVGSISHTKGLCIAVAALTPPIASLGIDVEAASGLSPELWPLVCTPSEKTWLNQISEPERERAALLIFSAKEAFYKAQYILSNTKLAFTDVELRIDLSGGRWWASPRHDLGAWLQRGQLFEGRFKFCDGFLVNGLTLLSFGCGGMLTCP